MCENKLIKTIENTKIKVYVFEIEKRFFVAWGVDLEKIQSILNGYNKEHLSGGWCSIRKKHIPPLKRYAKLETAEKRTQVLLKFSENMTFKTV